MYYKDNDGFFRFVFKCKKEKKRLFDDSYFLFKTLPDKYV